jgi:hypothetical protein
MGLGFAVGAVLLSCLIGAAILFTRGNQSTRQRHAKFGQAEVESALESVLDDAQSHDAFDLFLAWPIDDPYLESIRKQCHEVVRMTPPAKRDEDIGQKAKDQIRGLLRDLRERTA